jgi:hypothetical protein
MDAIARNGAVTEGENFAATTLHHGGFGTQANWQRGRFDSLAYSR